jgi:hypothetical protein
MQILSTKRQQQIECRRDKVLELSTIAIARITLHAKKSIISREIACFKQQAQANLNSHIQDNLPEEYHNYMTRINQLLKIIWKIANKSGHMDNENA